MQRLRADSVRIDRMGVCAAACFLLAALAAPSWAQAPQPQPQPQPTQAPQPSQAAPQASPAPPPPPESGLASGAEIGPPMPETTQSAAGIDSLVYRRDDADKIRRALDIYRRSQLPVSKVAPAEKQEEEDFLSKIARGLQTPGTAPTPGAAVAPPPPFEFPKFYLESLMRHTDSNWAVWMDGKKFTTLKPSQGELEVIFVASNQARFAWKPTSMSKVRDAWNQYRESRSPGIELVEGRNVLEFNLSPNQTFYPEQMKIQEGKVAIAPTKAVDKPGDKPADGASGSGAPAPAPTGAAPASAPADAGKQGFSGLQNVYDNEITNNLKQAR